MATSDLTQEIIKQYLSYDPETGVFIRIASESHNARIGVPTGYVGRNGRIYISLLGRAYLAHHLAWLYMKGVWPEENIGFNDDNYTNLKFDNLHEQSRRDTARKRSKSDTPGVSWDAQRNKWFAKVTIGYKQTALGRYDNKDDAMAAVNAALDKANQAPIEWDVERREKTLTDRKNSYAWSQAKEASNGPVGWSGIDDFVACVGQRPTKRHRLVSPAADKPMGPDNWTWEASEFDFSTREGRKAYEQHRRVNYPDLMRDRELRKNFGISFEHYMEMSTAQGHVCAICSQPETDKRANGETRLLAVDHNHTTDAVRGLLCGACNKAIGYMCDDPERLESAARYMRLHNSDRSDISEAMYFYDPTSTVAH